MKNSILTIAILCCSIFILNAQQNFYISGSVTDVATGDPVTGHTVYVTADSTPVSQFVFNDSTLTDNLGEYQFTVPDGSNTGPNVIFTISTYDCNGQLHTEYAQNHQGTINHALIDFSICHSSSGGGSCIDSSLINTNHQCPTVYAPVCGCDGVTYSNDCIAHHTGGVTFYTNGPCSSAGQCQADFTYSFTLSGVQFHGINTSNSISTWYWDFGDGHASHQQNPHHQFAPNTSGIYTVCLTIEDGTGCTDTTCDTININHPPNCIDSTLIDPSMGCYLIYAPVCGCDGVTYGNDCFATYQHGVTSYTNGPCSTSGTCYAHFNYTHTLSGVQFYGAGSNTPGTSQIVTWQWDFGDGHGSTQQNPHHQFIPNTSGTYHVCLTITDTHGCSDTFCETIHVGSNNQCHAFFTWAYMNSTNYGVSFSGYSSTSNPVWHWDFGDGHTDSVQNPVHVYNHAGTYQVCLSIANSVCNHQYCDSITVPGGGSPGGHYSIHGNVYHGNTAAAHATVYLIQMQPFSLTKIDTTQAGQQGEYYFDSIPQGNYLVQAELAANSTNNQYYVPTYHYHSIVWSQADVVMLYSDQFHIDIQMVPASNLSGPGVISGNLSWSGGLKVASGSESELEGVTIHLLDENEEPVKYTYTNSDGNFTFKDIPYGSYQVYTEWLGKLTEPAYVTIDDQITEISNVQLYVGEKVYAGVTGVNELFVNEQIKVYPNPATEFFQIELKDIESAEQFSFSLTDVTGRVVKDLDYVCKTSTCHIQIQTTGLSSGVYYLHVQNKQSTHTRKLVITSNR